MHMPNVRWILLCFAMALGGCGKTRVVVVGHPPDKLPPDTQTMYVDDKATMAEIDAGRSLSFDSKRRDHLNRIAARPNLGPQAQIHLVNAAFNQLSFDSSRTTVLLTLIQNDFFTPQAKTVIMRRLPQLHFNSNRQRILRAFDVPNQLPPVEVDHGTIAEINAAGSLSSSSARTEHFLRIAVRPQLSPDAQVHLVNQVFTRLGSQSDRMKVLLALIDNDAFDSQGKVAVLELLPRLSSETDKRRILEALDERNKIDTSATESDHSTYSM